MSTLDVPRVNVAAEVAMLAERLGFPDPHLVREIRLLPDTATVVTYALNEQGSKFIVDGQVALNTTQVDIRT